MTARRIFALLLWTLPLDVVVAADPPTCPSAVFTVVAGSLIPAHSGELRDVVAVADGTVSTSRCPATQAIIKAAPKGSTILRASWPACDGERNVRLRARLDESCLRMTGSTSTPHPRRRRRFVATYCTADLCFPSACASNADCDASSYCLKTVGACNATGACYPRPEVCTTLFDPVCGCDRKTYSNACAAARAGVSVVHEGTCGEPCGESADFPCPATCTDNVECGEQAFCARESGHCTGVGVCLTRPRVCTRERRPVCGCDGTTHANACVATSGGVNITHSGSCE